MKKDFKKDTHKSKWLLGNCNHTMVTKIKKNVWNKFPQGIQSYEFPGHQWVSFIYAFLAALIIGYGLWTI